MKIWTVPILFSIALFHPVMAQGSTVLDGASYNSEARTGRINKCVSVGQRAIYTERDCPSGYELDSNDWMANANITHKSDPETTRFYEETRKIQQERAQQELESREIRNALEAEAREMELEEEQILDDVLDELVEDIIVEEDIPLQDEVPTIVDENRDVEAQEPKIAETVDDKEVESVTKEEVDEKINKVVDDKAEADKAEADKVEADKVEADKVEADKVEADKVEADKKIPASPQVEKPVEGEDEDLPDVTF